jgi:nicotinate phosphoribosyltransferase
MRLNKGQRQGPRLSLAEIRSFSGQELEIFDSTYKRLLNPHIYKVSMTEKLRSLKLELINSFVNNM